MYTLQSNNSLFFVLRGASISIKVTILPLTYAGTFATSALTKYNEYLTISISGCDLPLLPLSIIVVQIVIHDSNTHSTSLHL